MNSIFFGSSRIIISLAVMTKIANASPLQVPGVSVLRSGLPGHRVWDPLSRLGVSRRDPQLCVRCARQHHRRPIR